MGTPSFRAARTAGMLAYPPTVTTTLGSRRRKRATASLRARHIFGAKARLRRLNDRWKPTTSKNVCGYRVSGSSLVSIPRIHPT